MVRALWRAWLAVARTIGHIQSRLILALAYFVVIAPFALAVRLFVDPLGLRRTAAWHPLSGEGRSASSLRAARQQS